MLLRMAESFCVTFGSEELRPLSLSFSLTLRKRTDLKALIGSVSYWIESPLKGQHTSTGSLFCFFRVTEVVWEALKRAFSSLSESQGQTYYLGREGLRHVAKARSAVNQSKCALWLHGPEH